MQFRRGRASGAPPLWYALPYRQFHSLDVLRSFQTFPWLFPLRTRFDSFLYRDWPTGRGNPAASILPGWERKASIRVKTVRVVGLFPRCLLPAGDRLLGKWLRQGRRCMENSATAAHPSGCTRRAASPGDQFRGEYRKTGYRLAAEKVYRRGGDTRVPTKA
jgi:hypothetical protein